MNIDAKSILARLFASENITIRHSAKFDTASFDVKHRVLNLPVWKDMSNELYNLLIAHEVSHALNTPWENGWETAINESAKEKKGPIFQHIVNIIEDVRIDKLIKTKFPGIKRDYFFGSKNLVDRGFFDTKDKKVLTDVANYRFLDRINIHFKCKDHLTVPFKSDEKKFIDKVDACSTFDEVLNISNELYEYLKEQNELEQESETLKIKIKVKMKSEKGDQSGKPSSDEESPGSGAHASASDKESLNNQEEELKAGGKGGSDEEKNDQNNEESEESDSSDSDHEKDKEENDSDNSIEIDLDDEGEESDESDDSEAQDLSELLNDLFGPEIDLDKKIQQELNSTDIQNVIYCNLPDDRILQSFIIDNKRFVELVKSRVYSNDFETNSASTHKKFHDEKMIQFMHKVFEQKKAASEYSKMRIAKTGKIDTNKLHNYKFKDDLFLRNTIVQNGKNHGAVILVDFSSSMTSIIESVIKQVVELMEFCRKSNIKYKIYAYTNYGYYNDNLNIEVPTELYKEGDMVVSRDMKFVEIFTSEMSNQDRKMMVHAFLHRKIAQRSRYSEVLDMGGTPSLDAVMVIDSVISKFRKTDNIEVMNFILLTDGQPNNSFSYVNSGYSGDLRGLSHCTDVMMKYKNSVIHVGKNVASKKVGDSHYSISSLDIYFELIAAMKKYYNLNVVLFDITGSTRSSYIYLDRYFNEKSSNDYSDCEKFSANCIEYNENSKFFKNVFSSYYIIYERLFRSKAPAVNKLSKEELSTYMTSESSSFKEKSLIMRKFCEIISKNT